MTISETEFLRQVTDLATILGWQWAHFRPARTAYGWRTPVMGPIGAGFPDLVLVRRDRLVFAELKRDKGKLSDQQTWVLGLLGQAAEAYAWRPEDLELIAEVLA